MRLALLILTCLTVFALITGYLALIDVFDPMGTKMIFGVTMGLLFFAVGLKWVFYYDLRSTRRKLDKCNRFHAISGLLNRQETLKTIKTQMKAARRHRHPYSALLVGMDEFSDINNRMGHRGGDILLKHVGERIMSIIREEDLAGHYVGDTFVIGACHADEEGALKLAQRVKEVITEKEYKTRGALTQLEATVAVATAPPEEYDPETLLYKLEDRLKSGKAEGGATIINHD